MARPKINIDEREVYELAKIHCTNEEIAEFFQCSVDTITRRFADILTKGRADGKGRLRKHMWNNAAKGNATIQIWLSKQYLGMAEKQEILQTTVETLTNEDFEKTIDIYLESKGQKRVTKGNIQG